MFWKCPSENFFIFFTTVSVSCSMDKTLTRYFTSISPVFSETCFVIHKACYLVYPLLPHCTCPVCLLLGHPRILENNPYRFKMMKNSLKGVDCYDVRKWLTHNRLPPLQIGFCTNSTIHVENSSTFYRLLKIQAMYLTRCNIELGFIFIKLPQTPQSLSQ